MPDTVTVTVPTPGCRHGKPWGRVIDSLSDPKPKDGRAIVGQWLSCGQLADLDLGAVVVLGGWEGSQKNGNKTADLYVVGPKGRLLQWQYVSDDQWMMKVRDELALVLAMDTSQRIAYAAKEMLSFFPPDRLNPDRLDRIIDTGGCDGLECYRQQGEPCIDFDRATAEEKVAALEKAVADRAALEVRRQEWLATMQAIVDEYSRPLVEETVTPSPLAGFSTSELLAEIQRRGVV